MLDFIEQAAMQADIDVETGYGGLELKHKDLLPRNGEEFMFVFPKGGDPSAYKNDKYTGSDLAAFNSGVLWMHSSDLNPEAQEAFNIDNPRAVTRTFIMAAEPTDQEWYLDLGYSHNKKHENEKISNGSLTPESYVAQRGGKWFAGNSVMPEFWYHIPAVLVSVEGKGAERTFKYTKTVWLKLKGTNAQMGALLGAFDGLDESDNPSVQYRVIKVVRTGEQSNYYTFTRMPYEIPDGDHELIDAQAKRVEEIIQSNFKAIFENQHNGIAPSSTNLAQDKKSNDAVRQYLVSISTAEDWPEFVEQHNILAEPVDVSQLETVSVLSLDE
jgi:hypothetical protein